MGLLFIYILAFMVVAVITWRRPVDLTLRQDPRARWLLYGALLLLGLYAISMLVSVVIAAVSDRTSGIALMNLVPVAVLALLAYLAYRRPVEIGWGLLVIGLILAIYTLVIGERDAGDRLLAIVLVAAPLLLSGLLLLAGNWLARGHLRAA